MNAYDQAILAMEELFSRDCQFSLATARDNVPSVRVVDTYFEDGSFYIVTYGESQKAKEMEANGHVALCSGLYRFTGTAHMIGHPLEPRNKEIREKLTEAFSAWYFRHNDEDDPHMRYVRIDLSEGFFHKDGTGYNIDFMHKEAETFPFAFEPVIVE
mgnify:CR=1 FL=1